MTVRIHFVLVIVAIAAGASCGPNQRILNSAQEAREAATPPPANSTPTVRTFDQDLTAMRNADFNFIYVLRRHDGGVLDADEKSFISTTTPPQINRKTLSDEGRAVMIGSNFRLPPDILATYKSRFAFEDYSKPESEIPNSNSNR